MGTNSGVGPGFTTDRRRLNVLLTRSRSGLVIIGDLSTTENLKSAGKGTILVETDKGEKLCVQAKALLSVHRMLKDSGRVATMVRQEEKWQPK
jgi:AAA domain-containing protein